MGAFIGRVSLVGAMLFSIICTLDGCYHLLYQLVLLFEE